MRWLTHGYRKSLRLLFAAPTICDNPERLKSSNLNMLLMKELTSSVHPDKVLLHSCCAPCSAAILEWLSGHGIETVVFFCNPNIYPEKEYEIRKQELQRYCKSLGIRVIDADYDHEKWREAVKGLEMEPERGKRCLECFRFRMLATAKCARDENIRYFTTTLAGSRWKRLEQVDEAGLYAAEAVPPTEYWQMNWRKGGLQNRRGELLKENGFYNQQYCGCEFSMSHLKELPAHLRITPSDQ